MIEEGSEVLADDFEDALLDSALIGAAERVEHYELAAHETVHEFAKLLGTSEQASLLQETLDEEKKRMRS